ENSREEENRPAGPGLARGASTPSPGMPTPAPAFGGSSRQEGNAMTVRARSVLSILAFASAIGALAQEPAPTPAPSPTPPPNIDVRMIRLKISAGDLASAESILEVHRAEHGEDGDYVLGVAWVARGAALLGDWKAASEWAKAARKLADERLRTPADYEK